MRQCRGKQSSQSENVLLKDETYWTALSGIKETKLSREVQPKKKKKSSLESRANDSILLSEFSKTCIAL